MGKLPSKSKAIISDLGNMFDGLAGQIGDNRFVRNIVGDSFKIDVEETEKEYIVHAELPGVTKEELKLTINDGQLTIAVSKTEEVEEEDKNYIYKERYQSSRSRSIFLQDALSTGIKARLDQGVLTVTVLKEEKPDTSVDIDIE